MRKKKEEHANHERWLVSYADFITLLFAFFVVMYAISQADIAKFRKVAASMKRAFPAGNSGFVGIEGEAGGDTVNPFDPAEPKGGRVIDLPAGKYNTASDPDPEINTLREQMEESVSLSLGTADASEAVSLQYESRGLLVRIMAKGLFAPGEEAVAEDMRPLMDRIGRVLAKTERAIRIEGHVDRHELEKPEADRRQSLALSTGRASWLADYWIRKFDLDPKRLGVAGYGHFRPLSPGDEPWDQAKNRRIEIIILRARHAD